MKWHFFSFFITCFVWQRIPICTWHFETYTSLYLINGLHLSHSGTNQNQILSQVFSFQIRPVAFGLKHDHIEVNNSCFDISLSLRIDWVCFTVSHIYMYTRFNAYLHKNFILPINLSESGQDTVKAFRISPKCTRVYFGLLQHCSVAFPRYCNDDRFNCKVLIVQQLKFIRLQVTVRSR